MCFDTASSRCSISLLEVNLIAKLPLQPEDLGGYDRTDLADFSVVGGGKMNSWKFAKGNELAESGGNMECLRSTGTLIVAKPSRVGLFIAADSCVTLGDRQKYPRSKLILLTRPRRTVLAVAGDSRHYPLPPEGTTDILAFIHNTTPSLNLEEVARACLEAGPEELTEIIIRDTASKCTEAANKLIRKHPEVLTKRKHPDFFHLVVASFQPSTGKSTIGTCRACVENEVLRTLKPEWIEFEQSNVSHARWIGDKKWIEEKVEPLEEYKAMTSIWRLVAQTTRKDAEDVCVKIIKLAAKIAASDEPKSGGIALPIDGLFIGEKEPPERCQWASLDN